MKIYCEKCKKLIENYDVVEREIERELKGVPYTFIGEEAVCPVCGSVVFVSEIAERNQKRLYEEYRRAHDLISLEDILSIPRKYHISKRNISKYLSWGDVTFSRYCNGYMPTKQNSEILKEVAETPEYLADKIIKYRQTHPEDKSAKSDLDKILGREKYIPKNKIFQVAEYIIKKIDSGRIERLRLMKLLYYVQGFYKAISGVFMFNDDCQAWQYGPVYPDVRKKFLDLELDAGIYLDEINIDEIDLDEDEKELIDGVLAAFGKMTNDELIAITHKEQPWKNARRYLPDVVRSQSVIRKEDIADYFEHVVAEYNIRDADDIAKYPSGKLHKVKKIA